MNVHATNQFLEISHSLKFEPFTFEPIDLSKMQRADASREDVLEAFFYIDKLIENLKNGTLQSLKFQKDINKLAHLAKNETDFAISKPKVENSILIHENSYAAEKYEFSEVIDGLELYLKSISNDALHKMGNIKIDSLVTVYNKYLKELKNSIWLLKSLNAQMTPRQITAPLNFTKLLAEID